LIGLQSETFFFIRLTRAEPPGHAGEDPRRATYGTALEQFEELISAASEASPAVRPLPLFYALSQAGRAIAAAYIPEKWRLYGHGLVCPEARRG
jgi:YaaC-like Protein